MKLLVLAAALAVLCTPALSGPAMAQPDGGDWFAAADTNRDRAVTRAEFLAYRDANFAKLDRNGDHVVSPADFPRLARFRPQFYSQLTEAIDGADRNRDGAISRTELAAAPPVLFDRADTNRDGRVVATEFEAARAAARAPAKR